MTEKASADVIPFSKPATRKPRAVRCVPVKIRGEVTFSKPKPLSVPPSRPLLALCDGETEMLDRLLTHLRNLDVEQLQIVELFVLAIERGAI